jgi:UDP-2-acetamido-3-amino-2,3-dideoxy-glucuronate N-acetyltransferase
VELVRSGQFGPLRYVYSDRLSFGKIRTEEDVIWSYAPHDLSMVLTLAGAEPEEVTAQGTAFVNAGIADFGTLQMRFSGGLRADIRVSWMHYKKVQQIVAVCDRATLVFTDSETDWERKLVVHEHRIERANGAVTPNLGEEYFVTVPYAEPLREECRHFLDSIAAGRPPLTDGKEGGAVLRVLRRASEALLAESQHRP